MVVLEQGILVSGTGSPQLAHNWLVGQDYSTGQGFSIRPSTAVGGTTWATPSIFCKNNGNVGIGTSAPAATLEVVEDNTTGGTYEVLKLKTSSINDVAPKILIEGNRNSVVQQAAILLEVAPTNTQKLRFQVDDTGGTLRDRLTIDSAGNVGIVHSQVPSGLTNCM